MQSHQQSAHVPAFRCGGLQLESLESCICSLPFLIMTGGRVLLMHGATERLPERRARQAACSPRRCHLIRGIAIATIPRSSMCTARTPRRRRV